MGIYPSFSFPYGVFSRKNIEIFARIYCKEVIFAFFTFLLIYYTQKMLILLEKR